MVFSRRVWVASLVVVATALTLAGLVTAATDPDPNGGPRHDGLVLNGRAPTSVGLAFQLNTDARSNASGTLAINFAKNTLSGQMQVPLLLSSATFSLRGVDGKLFVNNPNLNLGNHATWYDLPLTLPALFGVSLEFTRPDVAFIHSFPKTWITRDGYQTTYHFEKSKVSVTPVGYLHLRATKGDEILTVTTGEQGEVIAASVTIRTAHAYTLLSMKVLWYNHSVLVLTPPKSQWAAFPAALVKDIRGTQFLHDFVLPNSLLGLMSSLRAA